VSRLRAKCPDCLTYTAVALGEEYQCHSCGREFATGLVRVPRAWGAGGEEMAEAAHLPLAYPEAGVVAEETLQDQTLVLAAELPNRPVVLGGCCCSHIGAVEGLAARHDRVGVIWFDAHGDLNTAESSPSGNEWGMPLRMLVDGGAVAARDVALVAARNLDPPEEEYLAASEIHVGGADAIDAVLGEVDCAYVAFDADSLEPGEAGVWMPEPGGLALADAEALVRRVAERGTVLGIGFSGLLPDPANIVALERIAAAAGL
jgi:arginase family enzyme